MQLRLVNDAQVVLQPTVKQRRMLPHDLPHQVRELANAAIRRDVLHHIIATWLHVGEQILQRLELALAQMATVVQNEVKRRFLEPAHQCRHFPHVPRITQLRANARLVVKLRVRLDVDPHHGPLWEIVTPGTERTPRRIPRQPVMPHRRRRPLNHRADADFQDVHWFFNPSVEQNVVERGIPVAVLVRPVLSKQFGEVGGHGYFDNVCYV